MTSNCSRTRYQKAWTAFCCILILSLLLGGCGRAQTPRMYKVGILSGLNFIAGIADVFKAKMTELGYIEGENITYSMQVMDFDMAGYQAALQQFVAEEVDLILVYPTEAAQEAKIATEGTGIPVVFSFAFVEDTGLIESIRSPGGNMTGVRYPGPDLALKRYEVMLELAPQIQRIWIPYQRGYPVVKSQMDALRPVAQAAGITLIEFPANDAAEVQAELDKRGAQEDVGFDAILFLSEPLAVTAEPFEVMARFAYAHQIPIGGAMFVTEDYTSLFGIIGDIGSSGVEAALIADKILRGTPAGSIPVVSAESYLSVSLKAAEALGVTIPAGLLAQANEIIR